MKSKLADSKFVLGNFHFLKSLFLNRHMQNVIKLNGLDPIHQ